MTRRALVVDDSRTIRMILGRMLGELDFTVEGAGNGREALDKLKVVGAFELVLVDWNMPVMDGLEFVKAVRSKPEYKDMTVVMVTTESEKESMIQALEAGANEYITKPFTTEIIQQKLESLGIGKVCG